MSTAFYSIARQRTAGSMLPCLVALLVLLSQHSCTEQNNTTQPTDNNNELFDGMPVGNNNLTLRIIALVPNPKGEDDYAENWTLRNFSKSKTVQLSDYKLVDIEAGGNIEWQMNGSLAPGESITIKSDKTAQLLNSGDEVFLYANDGTLVQSIRYAEANDGDIIKP